MPGKTMFAKIWDAHTVREVPGEPAILFIDLHLVHEVTSPQAFEGLRLNGRRLRHPELTIATLDHNVPTIGRLLPIVDPISRQQVEALTDNCREFGIELFDLRNANQGIVHVIGPELGITRPGLTIVCGDSHTSTHGALGALAFGIGTSEVEHVLATQCLQQDRPKTMEVRVDGTLAPGVTPKDVILAIIGKIGVAGATGYAIEYTGEVIRSMSMEGRMTVCNMSIEAGGRAGMVAPDATTIEYLRGRERSPKGAAFEQAAQEWLALRSDPDAQYDEVVLINGSELVPYVTWGTNPGQVAPITGTVPDPSSIAHEGERRATERSLAYMALQPGVPLQAIALDRVFIGSCTNARIEDLRLAAAVARGKHVHPNVQAMVVPGSMHVKQQAEQEGLDRVFLAAGFEWRDAGCSMCLGMNPDILSPGQRCASTSNRNFEGRQGKGGRTHLVSPAMAAAAAITGHLTDVRHWQFEEVQA